MKKQTWITLLVIAVILIGIRIALPFVVLKVVNNKLADLDGYRGYVKDIDLHLYRGAYIIDSIDFVKTGDSLPLPFVSVKEVDISIEWRALFKGRIVSEIILNTPALNFATGDSDKGEVTQSGEETDWIQTVKELTPFSINRFEVINGTIAYKDFATEPKVDIRITHLDVVAKNLTNVEKPDEQLPASVEASGNAFDGGNFTLSAQMNVLKQIPDIDLNFKIEDAPMVNFNSFLRAYTNTDAEEGTFNLYTEVAVKDAAIDGYVKPVIENLTIIQWKEEEEPFLNKVWQSIVGGVTSAFKNHPKDRFATQVPVNGNVMEVETGIWVTIWNVVKNAFIEAFTKSLEGTIDFYNEE